MMILQKPYRYILNRTFCLTKKIPEIHRNRLLLICMILIVAQCYLFTAWQTFGIKYGYAGLFVVNTVLLLLVIIFSVKKELKPVCWNRFLYIPWFACAILILLSRIDHNITGAMMFFSGMMILVFPCLYFVWNNREDYHVLYGIISKAIVGVMFVFFLIHLLCFPMNQTMAYLGMSINPNSNGLIGISSVIAALYLMINEKRMLPLAFYIIVLGMALTFVYISLSRASVISTMLVILIFCICYFRSYQSRDTTMLKSLVVVLAAAVIGLVSVLGYQYILIHETPRMSDYLMNEMVLKSYAETGEVDTNENDSSPNQLVEKFHKGEDLDTISSGRTIIWTEYFKALNLRGNERGEHGLYIEKMGWWYSAHNSYLEIAYRSGIIAGICYAFIAIYAACYAFRFIFSKKLFDYRLSLIPMAVMAFGVLSNVERAMYPVEKVHILLFFLALAPMFVKRESFDGQR